MKNIVRLEKVKIRLLEEMQDCIDRDNTERFFEISNYLHNVISEINTIKQ